MQKICYTDTMQYRKGIIDYAAYNGKSRKDALPMKF